MKVLDGFFFYENCHPSIIRRHVENARKPTKAEIPKGFKDEKENAGGGGTTIVRKNASRRDNHDDGATVMPSQWQLR